MTVLLGGSGGLPTGRAERAAVCGAHGAGAANQLSEVQLSAAYSLSPFLSLPFLSRGGYPSNERGRPASTVLLIPEFCPGGQRTKQTHCVLPLDPLFWARSKLPTRARSVRQAAAPAGAACGASGAAGCPRRASHLRSPSRLDVTTPPVYDGSQAIGPVRSTPDVALEAAPAAPASRAAGTTITVPSSATVVVHRECSQSRPSLEERHNLRSIAIVGRLRRAHPKYASNVEFFYCRCNVRHI